MPPPESMADVAESSEGAAEKARHACAGIGNAEEPCGLCHHCASLFVFAATEDATASACELELGKA